MADLFRLKNKLKSDRFYGGFGSPSLRKKEPIKASHIQSLLSNLEEVFSVYKENSIIEGVLINLEYKDVVAKSRRVKTFFKQGSKESDSFIVGSKIEGSSDTMHHVITYYISKTQLENLVTIFHEITRSLAHNEIITNDAVAALYDRNAASYRGLPLKTRFVSQFLVDCSNVDHIAVPRPAEQISETALVTIYDTGEDVDKLLTRLCIPYAIQDVWDRLSVALSTEAYDLLKKKAGYLVAMQAVYDKDKLKVDTSSTEPMGDRSIPSPTNQPLIGIIDTSFDPNVYFSEWVSVDDRFLFIKPNIDDMVHGTEICSIIVDGPALNPSLDDHCGRFQVLLCPVASAGKNSWLNIAASIKEIVQNHPDIHVWNLSLGSEFETDENYVSPVAAFLDQLQAENPNILFVVAGTNVPDRFAGKRMRVGSPADSINSLVVNAVTFSGEVPNYARRGPVLSFYRKPDISYYGGEDPFGINVMVTSSNEAKRSGTSFAAPWIARKACFLMDIMGFSRDEAKALLINSALSFDSPIKNQDYLGYGVVPITIEEVVEPKRDEVRFVIKDICESYYTFSYDIPVPVVANGFPFKARVVMSAMLKCDRNKGIDYTNEELGISFGRMKAGKIKSINGNVQDETDSFTDEETARSLFRKWDNIKVISEQLTKKRTPLKVYDDNGLWGIRITSKLRNDSVSKERKTRFALVVTLKEIYGQERADDFERRCLARGWIVERINVESKLSLYNMVTADLKWDE